MKQITISLKDEELSDLLKIIEIRKISCLHRAVKIAIVEFVERFKENELQHKIPEGKLIGVRYKTFSK